MIRTLGKGTTPLCHDDDDDDDDNNNNNCSASHCTQFYLFISISLYRLSLVFVFEGLSEYLHFVVFLVTSKIFVWVNRYRTP